jgi:hypothetical protein
MFQEPKIELTGLQRLAIQATADQDFKPSRRKVLNALTALLNHRTNSADGIPATVRVPGWLSESEEGLLPFVRDPIGVTLKLGIRRLGEIASEFMTIDEMTDLAEEAAVQSGDPGVRGCMVDKLWDGLRDRNGNCWIA